MVFVYLVKNVTYAKKPKAVVKKAQINTFVIYVFFEKNVVSV